MNLETLSSDSSEKNQGFREVIQVLDSLGEEAISIDIFTGQKESERPRNADFCHAYVFGIHMGYLRC